MSQTRKQLQTEILSLESLIHQQQQKSCSAKTELSAYKLNHSVLIAAIILIPGLIIGWRMNRTNWLGKVMIHTKEILSLTFFNFVRKQLFSLLSFV